MSPRITTLVLFVACGGVSAQVPDTLEIEDGEIIEMPLPEEKRLASPENDESVGKRWHQPRHKFTVTASPVWAVIGAVDISGEYRSSPEWGFLLNVLTGSLENIPSFANTEDRHRSFRGQVRRYVPGEGGHLAGEFSRWSITEPEFAGGPDDHFAQWRLAVLIGHKFVMPAGLTMDMQAGGYVAVLEEDTDPENGFDFPRASPILRWNVGWSF